MYVRLHVCPMHACMDRMCCMHGPYVLHAWTVCVACMCMHVNVLVHVIVLRVYAWTYEWRLICMYTMVSTAVWKHACMHAYIDVCVHVTCGLKP
jgi:hypothetical protein